MSTITREQLILILEEKLDQKFAPFNLTILELKKSVDETKELLNFVNKQCDVLLEKVTSCEAENKSLRKENLDSTHEESV